MAWFGRENNTNSSKQLVDRPSLPEPDKYGNYWMGKDRKGPAIFKAGKSVDLVRSGRPKEGDYWFVSLGLGEDVVMVTTDSGKKIRYFSSPQEALGVLRELVGCNGK